MKRVTFIILISLFAAAVSFAQTVVFKNVNVIPMDTERVLTNQIVIVKNGVIAEIGPTAKVPKGAEIIDATGKFLIPGLADMHTHLLSDGDEYPKSIAEDELKVMIANGVTTIRLMIGTPEQLILRARSAKGEIIAPTIYSASPHLTGKKQGNDFVVNTPEEAVTRSANQRPPATTSSRSRRSSRRKCMKRPSMKPRRSGSASSATPTADSSASNARSRRASRWSILTVTSKRFADDAPMRGSVSDLYVYNPKNWESLDYIDESKIAKIAKMTVESNPFVDPTQHFMKNTFGMPRTEESIRAQPDFRFYPKKAQDFYIGYLKRTPLNQISYEKRAKWVAIRDKMIKAIYDAGGKILAGSDTPEFLWLYGFTMHRELKALNEAGLTRFAALEAATKNPALFSERSRSRARSKKERMPILFCSTPIRFSISQIPKNAPA
ncbi:MAG: hypothetical protein IPJ30_06940 [Acidobacteria bacterium]|nr:hypothetical protein [Acidobacteriota bacterium]